ncbi:hypothetical protein NP493_178g03035 [Ridgeia piscesae]|uniref:Uncharacterized protein n=1 Tax=Ridgeia piscesae TaxID=27915 RepID=A0AAD9P354_RIDPI|nr:hypothetical protein NP493_178g03035 [Ridgeia piscesae]
MTIWLNYMQLSTLYSILRRRTSKIQSNQKNTQQIAQSCSCNTRRPSSKYKAVNTQHLSHLFPKAS